MMMVLIAGAVVFVGWGFYLLSQRRNSLIAAMLADGFAQHEVKKALRLFDRKRHAEMADHCRAVIERRNLVVSRDWTKAEAYV